MVHAEESIRCEAQADQTRQATGDGSVIRKGLVARMEVTQPINE
jgi:hypothetical protein